MVSVVAFIVFIWLRFTFCLFQVQVGDYFFFHISNSLGSLMTSMHLLELAALDCYQTSLHKLICNSNLK